MSARLRPRSSRAHDHGAFSLAELLIVAPVAVVLVLGALQWS